MHTKNDTVKHTHTHTHTQGHTLTHMHTETTHMRAPICMMMLYLAHILTHTYHFTGYL